MTFDARERSAAAGEPIELYTFALDTEMFLYTSADRAIEAGPEALHQPWAISRTDIESTAERSRLGIKIRAPRTMPVVDLFRISPPSHAVTCVIQQLHEGDGQIVTIWTGRVLSCEFVGASAEMTLEPIFTSVRRMGLRRHVQRQCPHVLYGPACRLNRNDWAINSTVATITGSTITAPDAASLAENYFAGGYIEYASGIGSVLERLFVLRSTAAGALVLASQPFGLSVGDPVTMYAGCAHNTTACEAKNNIANFGGFPYFPKKNPFAGDPIY